MAKKPTEKMLFSAALDLYYADQLSDQMVEEYNDLLKEARKTKRKSKKLLDAAIAHYKEVYGTEPRFRDEH